MTLLVPAALACSGCFAGTEATSWAWMVATGVMIAVPAAAFVALAIWLKRIG